LPLHQPSWHEMLPVFLALKKSCCAQPIILVSNDIVEQIIYDYGLDDSDILPLGKRGVPATGVHRNRNISPKKMIKTFLSNSPRLYDLSHKIYFCIKYGSLETKTTKKLFSKQLNEMYVAVKELSDQLSPQAVVVAGDRHLGYEPAVLRVCREQHILTIIPPISYTGNKEDLTLNRMSREYNADLYPEIMRRYPHQFVWDTKTRRNVLFYPPPIIEALAQNDMLPENPWVMGGGYSTFIMADGHETLDRYVKLGCMPKKIIVTGHGAHDTLYKKLKERDRIKKKLFSKYAFDPRRMLILLSLPQLAEHNILNWNTHWEEIRFLCKIVSELDANCLISLHPKMNPEMYRFIQSEYSLHVAKERLAEILPAADIFAATFSSTVQWAVLCKIPTIVFDFYGFNFSMYDLLDGVRVINERKKLRPEFNKLLLDKEYYCKLSMGQEKMTAYVSPFDGKCMDRIVDVILNAKNGTG
jgi:hypothetical protein